MPRSPSRSSSDPREVAGPTDQQLHGDLLLARLADRQHGVVARRQLGAIGLSPTMVRHRLERGQLVILHRGVYAVGHRRLGPRGHAVAALFAAGPGAVLSHRNAATLHNLRPGGHRDVDVTVERQRRGRPGICIHRAGLPADEVTQIDRLPVTTLARTLVDIAGTLPRDHVEKALHEADRTPGGRRQGSPSRPTAGATTPRAAPSSAIARRATGWRCTACCCCASRTTTSSAGRPPSRSSCAPRWRHRPAPPARGPSRPAPAPGRRRRPRPRAPPPVPGSPPARPPASRRRRSRRGVCR